MLLLSMLGLLAGCEGRIGYEAVSIRPGYGYVDGCDTVQVSGHGFGDDPAAISVTIDGNEVTDITYPEAEIDIGYLFFGTAPAASEGVTGAVDVVVTRDGESSTLTDGFYYVACPAAPNVEAVAPSTGVSSGDTISLAGCNIDAAAYEVSLYDATTQTAVEGAQGLPLTSICGTAVAGFTAPDLADGSYHVIITDTAGNILVPAVYPCFPDSADTAASECEEPLTITYGGAQ